MFLLIVLILMLAVILSGITIYFVNKNPGTRKIFQIIYAVLIVVLALLLTKNILDPIFFKQERQKRENATIERLKDIRTCQVAYKDKYGAYTGSFDTLIHFVKTDSFELEGYIHKPYQISELSQIMEQVSRKSHTGKPTQRREG